MRMSNNFDPVMPGIMQTLSVSPIYVYSRFGIVTSTPQFALNILHNEFMEKNKC